MQGTTLRTALLSNALFSTISGLTFVMLSHSVAQWIGIGTPIIYRGIGIGLLGFAAFVAWTGIRKPINTSWAALISIADFGWVAGTLVLVALSFEALEPGGMLLLVIAANVLFFGLRQLQGISRVYAVSGKEHTHRLCVAVDTPASPDEIWPIIADLPSIGLYSPNLAQVILRDGAEPGVDAVRQCTDVDGKTWGEYCKRLDPQARHVEFEFLADEPGFPYPFKTMSGGWDVQPNSAGSTVTIWFEVTPKYGIAHPIILALMTRNLANSFGETVARMTAAARGKAVVEPILPNQYGVESILDACE